MSISTGLPRLAVSAALILALAGAACGTEPASEPAQTATALPSPTGAVPTNTPTADGLVVDTVNFAMDEARARPYMELLARLPDTADARRSVELRDFALIRQQLGIEVPGRDAGEEAGLDYLMQFVEAALDGANWMPLPIWPSTFREYGQEFQPYHNLGFDQRDLDQMAVTGESHNPAEVALGGYDPDATASALEACGECEPAEVRERAGVSYYAWGLEGQDLKKRLNPPLYDMLGRGGRLFVDEGAAHYAVTDEGIEQLIDAAAGAAPSLADNDDFSLAAGWLSSLGAGGHAWLGDQGFSIADVAEWSRLPSTGRTLTTDGQNTPDVIHPPRVVETTDITQETVLQAANKGPLLLPFSVLGIGTGFEDGETFTVIAIVHEDAGDAAENRNRLEARIREGAADGRLVNGVYTDDPWLDLVDRVEIGVQGRVVLARLYPLVKPVNRIGAFGGSGLEQTLVIHE